VNGDVPDPASIWQSVFIDANTDGINGISFVVWRFFDFSPQMTFHPACCGSSSFLFAKVLQ
jgi:hypothetical protein